MHYTYRINILSDSYPILTPSHPPLHYRLDSNSTFTPTQFLYENVYEKSLGLDHYASILNLILNADLTVL